jgi:hypothetical protein
MKKTFKISPFSRMNTGVRLADSWHNGGGKEILQYSRALRNAAKSLIGNIQQDRSARSDWDICPVVLLYRQALEIQLKFVIGEGSGFLPAPTDPISLSTTHSLRWLAQITCRTIKAVGWETEFKCEGASSLPEFTMLVNEVEAFDPCVRAIHSAGRQKPVSEFYRTFDIFEFAMKLDAVLELLDGTADALAAEWNARQDYDFRATV